MLRFALALLALSAGLCTMHLSAAVTIEQTAYQGWSNCYRISNGEVELIVTGDVGPRIIRYAYIGGRNILKEFPDQLGRSGEKEWTPRGGHRVWVAPEIVPITYALDNGPVQIKVQGATLEAIQPVEPATGLQKSMVIRLADRGSRVDILHRVRNAQGKAMELAPWVLTMMAPGGIGITGLPPRGTHPEQLAPTNPLVMWAFTDLSDPRWTFTRKYIVLRQDPGNKGQPQKIGTFHPATWGAYLLGNELFIKRSTADPTKRYPDFNASFETFTNPEFLELETLGPLVHLQPGNMMEHTEIWSLHRNVRLEKLDDATLDRVVQPLLDLKAATRE